jgi:hypothetical protein
VCCSLVSSTSSMGRSGELSDFECGLVIGCHISKMLPKSLVGNIIVKWKREGTTGSAAFNNRQGPSSIEEGGS